MSKLILNLKHVNACKTIDTKSFNSLTVNRNHSGYAPSQNAFLLFENHFKLRSSSQIQASTWPTSTFLKGQYQENLFTG